MIRQIPSYLRIHGGETDSVSSDPHLVDVRTQFWEAFTEATGWRVDSEHTYSSRNRSNIVIEAEDDGLMAVVSRSEAQSLATTATRVIEQLDDALESVRIRDAELIAKAVPMMPTDRRIEFADCIEMILAETIEATECDAAAFYLLDDDTSELKMRAQVGLPTSRLVDDARPLRGAMGDLEALVAGVMSVDDLDGPVGEAWNSPEAFASGMCVSVSEGSLPLGTIWIWSQEGKKFKNSDHAIARLAASNVISEIARENLSRREESSRDALVTLEAANEWQQRQLPIETPLADGWLVDGFTDSGNPLASSWFHWDILPDGSIIVVVAEALSECMDSSMIAATARAAFQSHSGYRLMPRQVLQRVGDTLLQTNLGEQLTSMFFGKLDPESGEGIIAGAGNLHSMVCSRYGFRPVVSVTDPLGHFPDSVPIEHSVHLLAGETLLIGTPGLLGVPGEEIDGKLSQQQLAAVIGDALQTGADAIMPALRRQLAGSSPVQEDRTALILSRL